MRKVARYHPHYLGKLRKYLMIYEK